MLDDARIDNLMRRTSLRQIEVITALLEHRSMTRAASALGMSVANVSRTTRRFEENLGMRLFEGEGRRYVLNPASADIFRNLEPMLRHIRDFRRALRHIDFDRVTSDSLEHPDDEQ